MTGRHTPRALPSRQHLLDRRHCLRVGISAAAGLALARPSWAQAQAQAQAPAPGQAPTAAARVETGFLDRTIIVDGERYRYQVYVPFDYASRSDWPVTLFLHGSGERGTDGMRQTLVGLAPAIRQQPERFPMIAVFPQARPERQWTGSQSAMALAALQQTLAEFRTDANRVYLTGLSMGGHGSWYLAYRQPELFAAVLPICGWVVRPNDYRETVVPPQDGPPMAALVKRLGRLPIYLVHGELDQAVAVHGSREPFAALQAAAAPVRYAELIGTHHNSWDAAYASDDVLRWLLAQRRR